MLKKFINALVGNEQKQETSVPQTSATNKADEKSCEHIHQQETVYDPETLHGVHYTVEEFDAEVKRRAEIWIHEEHASGENLTDADVDNIYFNYRRDVYLEWTGADMDQLMRWENANSLKYRGTAAAGFAKEDDSNPLMQPIHGLTLKDYAAMALKISSGIDYQAVCKAMGVESAVWEELNTLWMQRMQEDSTFTVSTLYGQYFAEGGNHPKLSNLQAIVSEKGKANLEAIKTDRYFYEELCGARQAAYEYGLDGAQWILENFDINLGDFQAVAMHYMTEQNKNFNSNDIIIYMDYQQEKQKEYAAKFAAEQGGNIAADIKF